MALRRWFRFRLRTLLIVATLCCIALAFVVIPARRQRQAVLELERRGALVRYVGRNTNTGQPLPPTWYQNWLGCDFGQRVFDISITVRALTELDWQGILICQPTELQIGSLEEGDRDLARAKELHSLRNLLINNTTVTERGLSQLAELRQLRILHLWFTSINDDGLAQLTKLHELETLTIRDPTVTANGISTLRTALPKCEIIWNGQRVP